MNASARNDDADVAGNDFGIRVQASTDNPDSDALREIDQADKDLATTRAQLAIAGWTLHELSNCGGGTSFVAARLATTRVLPDRHALRQFTRMWGGG